MTANNSTLQTEDELRTQLILLNVEFLHGVPVKLPPAAIDEIMQLIKARDTAHKKELELAKIEARIDELRSLWNSTQPDIVPQGAQPNDMSEQLHKRIAQLRKQALLNEKGE